MNTAIADIVGKDGINSPMLHNLGHSGKGRADELNLDMRLTARTISSMADVPRRFISDFQNARRKRRYNTNGPQ